MPHVIGVVTSPTGAVIRDILHRIADRFPVHVILWPALVQGELAKDQIEAGIRGFNALGAGDAIPRPDVLIVGRGGGSIEDLWPFNEENVVRAAFESTIPLISAVGHETDTTLIDYVSDARAPTPTGAAEIAVPVRADLILTLDEHEQRLKRALLRRLSRERDRLKAARLPRSDAILQPKRQRFDHAEAGLGRALGIAVDRKRLALTRIAARLRPESLPQDLKRRRQKLRDVSVRARPALLRLMDMRRSALTAQAKLLETLSHQATLKRGFALVHGGGGGLIRSAELAANEDRLTLTFADGDIGAVPDGKPPAAKPKPTKPRRKPGTDQGSLF